MRRRLGRGLAGAALVVAGVATSVVVAGSPAQAAPCSASRDYTYTWGVKSSCAPQTYRWWHRAWVKCVEGPNNTIHTYYGNYAGGLSVSKVQCGSGATKSISSYGVEQGQDD
ncbi:hypothetical protein O7602_20935 [Micromonospora sp. WMMD1128]|uniref:hypothetical protein n=1 Tax=Micromonospora sp. WMMD1128 TaxID=3015150 RepID=UPI00248A9EAA|nr:hypothetical protein [Micromonospora sp. WMMD1128]WBB72172.1 hypothetical protein O7602_20935 [Micromonospora sp. WMMD1128]